MTAPTTPLAGRLAGAFRQGPYRLPDGQILESYFDPYLLAGDPALLRETAAALALLLPDDTEVLAGPALAAVPLVTAVSLHTGLPSAILRPEPKRYGTSRQTEGAEVVGRRTVLLDDTARSGASLLRSARLLRLFGARVETALSVLDRELGAAPLLAGHRIALHSLLHDREGPS